jgi:uncharacterized protein YvpB
MNNIKLYGKLVGMPFLLVGVILAIIGIGADTPLDDNEKYLVVPDAVISLPEFPTVTQQTNHTCWAASLVAVSRYLGNHVTENELVSGLGYQSRNQGFLPNSFTSVAYATLNPMGYEVSQVNPASKSEILNAITVSLQSGMPVIIYYSTLKEWQPPNFDTHYSVIFGIDTASEIVRVSNPYGYQEDMPFSDLFDKLAFRNYGREPFGHRFARTIGLVSANNLFILHPTE